MRRHRDNFFAAGAGTVYKMFTSPELGVEYNPCLYASTRMIGRKVSRSVKFLGGIA